ncbi:unnamed protein product [marine sediment metagenome]|uniref:Uncharacterized protein n=1 Tax=marine sediment metagenome TaxID=412755 RepID=X1CIG6_9ZZZZ
MRLHLDYLRFVLLWYNENGAQKSKSCHMLEGEGYPPHPEGALPISPGQIATLPWVV